MFASLKVVAAFLVAGAIAAAHAATPPPSADVVVQGEREKAAEQVKGLVGSISASTHGQLARVTDGVCPRVIGIVEPYDQTIAKRISTDAHELGVPTQDKADCHPNMLVIFSDNAAALAQELEKADVGLTNRRNDAGQVDANKQAGRVYFWSRVRTLTADGIDGTDAAHSASMGAYAVTVKTASIISKPVMQSTSWSVLLIQTDAAQGKTLSQLGDYAAMRMLTRSKPPKRESSERTILSLFDESDAPKGLTQFDKVYVQALYGHQGNQPAEREQRSIARTINKASK